MARHLQANDPATDVSFDDTSISTASSGAITGDDVQEILDNQLTYLITVFTTLFGLVSDAQTDAGTALTASSGKANKAGDTFTGDIVIDNADIIFDRPDTSTFTSLQFTTNSVQKWYMGMESDGTDTLSVKKVGGSGGVSMDYSTELITLGSNITIAHPSGATTLYIDSPGAAEIFVDRGSDAVQALVRFRTAGANSWYFGLYTTGTEDFELHRGGGGTSGFIMDYATQYVKLKYGLELTYATASTVPYIDSSKNLVSSSVTPTELGYVSGVTSAIQTQLGTKPTISSGTSAPASTPGKVGDIFVDTSAKKLYFAAGTSSSADWIIAN